MPIESFFARAWTSLDALVAPLLIGRWWFLRVSALAIALCIFYHAPSRWDWNSWRYLVLQEQADDPLTQPDPWKYIPKNSVNEEGVASHLDKITFRLTIPILGRIFHTGKYSWFIFTALAGLAFYPLLAVLTERWLGDRHIALYLTAGFGLSWAGQHFFFDSWMGDAVAWFFLILSVASRRPGLIFVSVLAAAFTDERGVIASGGTLLFWSLGDEKFQVGKAELFSAIVFQWQQKAAVIAAWLVYFGLRLYLGAKFGLQTGTTMILDRRIVIGHLWSSIPYSALAVFQGLWLWLLLGLIGLLLDRRYLAAGGYAGVFLLLGGVSLLVLDFQRSLSYAVILFAVAWRARGLQPENALFTARLAFLFGLLLVTPWEKPLHYFHFFL